MNEKHDNAEGRRIVNGGNAGTLHGEHDGCLVDEADVALSEKAVRADEEDAGAVKRAELARHSGLEAARDGVEVREPAQRGDHTRLRDAVAGVDSKHHDEDGDTCDGLRGRHCGHNSSEGAEEAFYGEGEGENELEEMTNWPALCWSRTASYTMVLKTRDVDERDSEGLREEVVQRCLLVPQNNRALGKE